MHICCLDCREHLWIGQTDSFYSGEPHTMEALRQFLVKHRTWYVPRTKGQEYHELIYIPEPYSESIKDFFEQDWKEWDSDDFKTTKPRAKKAGK